MPIREDVVVSTVQAYGFAAAILLQFAVGAVVAARMRNRAGRLLATLFFLNCLVSVFYFARVFEGPDFGRPEGGPKMEFWFDAPTGPILAALAWELRKAHPARRFGGSEGIILAVAGLQFLLVTLPPASWTQGEVNSLVVRVPNFAGYFGLFLVMPWFGSRGPHEWLPRPEWLAAAFLMRPPELGLRAATAVPGLWDDVSLRFSFKMVEIAVVLALGAALLYALLMVIRLYVVERRLRPHTEVIPLLFLGGAMLGVLQSISTYGPRWGEAADLVNTSSLFFIRPVGALVAVSAIATGAKTQRALVTGIVGAFAAAGLALLLGGTTWTTFFASLPIGVAAAALFRAFAPALRHAEGLPMSPQPTPLALMGALPKTRPRRVELERLGAESAALLELYDRNLAVVGGLSAPSRSRLAALTRRERLLLCLLAADSFEPGEVFPRTYAGVHFYTHIPYNDLGTVVDRLNERGAAALRDVGVATHAGGPVRLVEKRRGARKYYLLTPHGKQAAEAVLHAIPGVPSDPRAWINLLGEGHYERGA